MSPASNNRITDKRARGTMLASTLPRSRIIPGPKVNMFSSQSVRARLLPATGQRVTEARQGFTFLRSFCVARFLETKPHRTDSVEYRRSRP